MLRLGSAVFLGGMAGTGLRLGIDLALPHADAEFPAGTLLANVVGAFLLGWLVAGLWTRPAVPSWLKAALGGGVLGSFTTFSAVMVSLVALVSAGFSPLAWAYLAATLLLGFAAAALGLRLGGRAAAERLPLGGTDAGVTP
ncbi:CrcB family protein [Cryobacterium sp. TMT1-21]|uniref:Fluoride-specific ion channel FluC n=1 Tax=Cryobacterium shii TaxID=1259235 RepID=A0AAQ2C630_9MICO|nr:MULTISPECIES: CrcB family protein [Cryobacterium]TFC46593.1 CrcB family protein [Cryobacterium shii]TFC84579.1 CrcB family protein [Cryobacterium sp. TmT2-59]TFD14117.1 CrcB family protein [Cryobacterium sp. TMT4-10]TFD17611.1 CrcB family protein [Cryobacterium sp. TMT1-21]TFD22712.1 CrcB family protein [Cryobacterium sp. TMT2-23]